MAEIRLEDIKGVLPFHEQAQRGLLGHLLTNERFFLQSRATIRADWFIDVYSAKVWAAALDFFDKYKRFFSLGELQLSPAIQREDAPTRNKLISAVKLADTLSGEYGLDFLMPQLTTWLQSRLYHHAVTESTNLFNHGKFDSAYVKMKEFARTIDGANFEQDNAVDFSNYQGFFDQQQLEYSGALTLGLDILDRQLLVPPPCKACGGTGTVGSASCIACEGRGSPNKGCLLKKDVTVLLAPTNVGKTTSMITIARHNIYEGKDVLFVSHEGRPEDLTEKIWCSMLAVNKHRLYDMYRTEKGQKILNGALAWMQEHFVYEPMNKPGLTVEEVEGAIRRKQDKWAAKHGGKGFDLIVDDYGAKLSTQQARGGKLERRNIDSYVYNYFVQIALDLNVHLLTAIQTNRDGSRVNQGIDGREKRLIRMEDVSETWDAMTAVANVISINRDAEAEAKDVVTYNICKSRSNKKNIAVLCKSNFACAITHSNKYGGISYRGDEALTGRDDLKLDDLLKNPPKSGQLELGAIEAMPDLTPV